MPILHTTLKHSALAAHKNLFYEHIRSGWLTGFGWEVLRSLVDHGRRTDLVIADDGARYFRIQVKTVQSKDESVRIENRWHGGRLDYIIIFSTQADWGYIAPAFTEANRLVNNRSHIRFHCHPENFKKALRRCKSTEA